MKLADLYEQQSVSLQTIKDHVRRQLESINTKFDNIGTVVSDVTINTNQSTINFVIALNVPMDNSNVSHVAIEREVELVVEDVMDSYPEFIKDDVMTTDGGSIHFMSADNNKHSIYGIVKEE